MVDRLRRNCKLWCLLPTVDFILWNKKIELNKKAKQKREKRMQNKKCLDTDLKDQSQVSIMLGLQGNTSCRTSED